MKSIYKGHRFPPEIISHAIWLYHRFTLSYRDIEDLLAERGISVSYEAIRYWCTKFGPAFARSLRRKQGRLGDIWHVDEVFITIRGERHYLWRALDQDGDVIDILVTKHRDRRAAKCFFRKALKHQGQVPWQLVTDKLRSYRAAHREVFPSVLHRTDQYENNRAEVSMNIPANRRGKCVDSNHTGRPNDFYHCIVRFKTCSESVAIISKQFIIDSSAVGLFSIGERRRACSEELQISLSFGAIISLPPLT